MNHDHHKMDHTAHDTSTSQGVGKHAGHSTAMFFRKFWVSLLLTIPVVLYADVTQRIFSAIGGSLPAGFPGVGIHAFGVWFNCLFLWWFRVFGRSLERDPRPAARHDDSY